MSFIKKSKLLLEESEEIFVFGGVALILLVEFFSLIMIYFNVLTKTFVIPVALVNVIIGYIFLERAFKGKKKLEKIKEVELIKQILKETKRGDRNGRR